jgi:cell division protein FtsL
MSEPKVDETKPSVPKPQKMVSRNVAVALGIICVILIAVIAIFSVTGISAQNSYNNLQNKNKQLQTWLTENVSQNENLQNQNSQLQTSLDENESQINNLTNILNLANSTVWLNDQTTSQPHGSSTSWTESANYAGYVSIFVLSSTTNSTYARTLYSVDGVNYDNTVSVGASGIVYFPVLPSSSITVEVGNNNSLLPATETVTITYYY